MQQTALTDHDRAIISRLALPALRNELRTDDATDYRTMRKFECTRGTHDAAFTRHLRVMIHSESGNY